MYYPIAGKEQHMCYENKTADQPGNFWNTVYGQDSHTNLQNQLNNGYYSPSYQHVGNKSIMDILRSYGFTEYDIQKAISNVMSDCDCDSSCTKDSSCLNDKCESLTIRKLKTCLGMKGGQDSSSPKNKKNKNNNNNNKKTLRSPSEKTTNTSSKTKNQGSSKNQSLSKNVANMQPLPQKNSMLMMNNNNINEKQDKKQDKKMSSPKPSHKDTVSPKTKMNSRYDMDNYYNRDKPYNIDQLSEPESISSLSMDSNNDYPFEDKRENNKNENKHSEFNSKPESKVNKISRCWAEPTYYSENEDGHQSAASTDLDELGARAQRLLNMVDGKSKRSLSLHNVSEAARRY
jgi:hypothetical protein